MKLRTVSAAVAALLTAAAPLGAAESRFCQRGEGAGGKIKLDYEIRPSLVVADATLDVPMSAISAGGSGESAFSFARTLGAILKSAGQPDDAAAREAFLGTMIGSLDNNAACEDNGPGCDRGGLLLNPYSAVVVPVEDRLQPDGGDGTGEGSLDPKRLLDPGDPEFGIRPLALFNRLDLAPADWSHCGEYRIVYAMPDGGFQKRFLLIFEAMLPNPGFKKEDAAASEAGCRPVAEFWAGLSGIAGTDEEARVERAKQLSQFYYGGAAGPLASFAPVVSFRHYGGDGGRGQVRANMFFELGWQLREWLTPLTVGPDGPTVAFVPETVKDNPISELYLDDLGGTPLAAVNIDSTALALHAAFVEHFGTVVQDHLFVERSKNFRSLRSDLNQFDVGALSEDDILVTTIGLGSSRRFDDFQSASNPDDNIDEPSETAGLKFRKMLELLLNRPEHKPQGGPGLIAQNAQILLNRAEAGTCSGCHQTSPRDGITLAAAVVKVKPDGTEVRWPDVVPGVPGFVHVDEARNLSVALEKHFLPVRRYMMGRHLCKDLPEFPASPLAQMSAASYVDNAINRQYLSFGLSLPSEAVVRQGPVAVLSGLEPPAQAAAIDELARLRVAARAAEEAAPGAFVDARRPH